MAKTAMEKLLEWLDEQPPLLAKGDLRKRIKKFKAYEKHIIKRSYTLGWEYYVHPRRYKWTSEQFYQFKYGPNSTKKRLEKERVKFLKIRPVKTIRKNESTGN